LAFSLPVVWAALFAALFNALDWSLPLGVMRGVELLAGAAVPLVLLVLGVQIQRAGLAVPSGVNWLATGIKLVVGPVAAFAAAYAVGLGGIDLAVVTLFGSMPPAVMVFMLALEFSDNAEEVARTVVVSTLGALLSVSVVVTLLRPLL
jgi:predicted permease